MIASFLALACLPLQDPAPTWSDGVGQLVHRACTECHRPGQAGPFALQTYADAQRRAAMLLEVVESRFMPPWQPVEGHGVFRGDRRLADADIDLLRAWVQAGAPEGDPEQAPRPPQAQDGWILGEPDLVVTMTEGFPVPADGPDIYHNFVVPLGLEEDVWVDAIEVRPGAPRVLHHVLFSIDGSGRVLSKFRLQSATNKGTGRYELKFDGIDIGKLALLLTPAADLARCGATASAALRRRSRG